MSFELTPDGLSTQTQDEVFDETTAKLRATFGNNLNTATDSIMGQWVNIFSEFMALAQQQALSVWQSFDPNNAKGVSLDQRAALTGSIRDPVEFSSVAGNLLFAGPGTANNGDVLQNDDNQSQWEVTGGPYVSAGPWPETIPATLQALDPGAVIANAGTNWSAVTAIPGIDTPPFENPTDDANLGRLEESDPDFRTRRQVELYSQNIGGLLAISAVVSKVDGVSDVRTYHNPATDPVDANGIPFKAFNVVVDTQPSPPGAALQQSIADAIFSALGVGGEAYGTDFNLVVVDAEGQPQPDIRFDMVSLKDVYAVITLDTTGTEEPISPNLADVVEAQVLEVANRDFTGIGQDTLEYKVKGIVSDLAASGQISGVVTVTVQLSEVGLGGPFIDPVPVGIRERADFDSANLSVVVLP